MIKVFNVSDEVLVGNTFLKVKGKFGVSFIPFSDLRTIKIENVDVSTYIYISLKESETPKSGAKYHDIHSKNSDQMVDLYTYLSQKVTEFHMGN